MFKRKKYICSWFYKTNWLPKVNKKNTSL